MRKQAELEIYEERLEHREKALSELEERLERKQRDVASYLDSVQEEIDRRESDWWEKQLGSRPESLAKK